MVPDPDTIGHLRYRRRLDEASPISLVASSNVFMDMLVIRATFDNSTMLIPVTSQL